MAGLAGEDIGAAFIRPVNLDNIENFDLQANTPLTFDFDRADNSLGGTHTLRSNNDGDVTATLGDGNDLNIFGFELTNDDSSDGGDGTDTVSVLQGLGGSALNDIQNFEVLRLGEGHNVGDTFNLDRLPNSDIGEIVILDASKQGAWPLLHEAA